MSPLRFSFVLHIHQPVGNFDSVFRQHAAEVYAPFLDFLEQREIWPIGLHVSGPLLEWLGANDVALHDRIGELASGGRIELLTAGWYEPILAALSSQDRATQLGWAREEMEARFGVTPRGLWLTERVWESDLPRDLAEAGIEYALIDDHLALKAGLPREALQRPLRTEAHGRALDLLAIDERLRYLIPFRPASELATDLRSRQAAGDAFALIGDDGEKFGGWPRTRAWLYDEGWLEAFGDVLDTLRAEEVVRLVTPAQIRAEVPASGPFYPPTGSYPEMEGWALGGHWKGFLARYEESNRMHKRMVALSDLCRERGDPPDVRRMLGRAQCNDAYWHGVFGGLYMKHLREGVRRELMRAECALRKGEPLGVTRMDVDFDGIEEWWVHSPEVSAWVSPRNGGTLTELVWPEFGIDVLDVLTRRHEEYHEEAVELAGTSAKEEPVVEASASIHDIEALATLEALPPSDLDVRTLVHDRVLPADLDFEAYRDARYTPCWSPATASGEDPTAVDGGLEWHFEAVGEQRGGQRVEKRIRVASDGTVMYSWSWDPGDFPRGAWFAPEVSLGTPVTLDVEPDAELWHYPIVTVSKCPEGFEEIEQGVSVTPRWPVQLGAASLVIAAPMAPPSSAIAD